MPRPKKPGAPEPKRRSRNGCWPCKNRKIKCGEEHPSCLNCQRTGEACDYSIRLNWEGRRGRRPEGVIDFGDEPTAPPSSLPAKGFKLVHQNPKSDASGSSSSRRLEPLTEPSGDPPKTDNTKLAIPSTPLGNLSFELPAAISDDVAPFQPPAKRARTSKSVTQADEPSDERPQSSHSPILDLRTNTSRLPQSSTASTMDSPVTPATSALSDDQVAASPNRTNTSVASFQTASSSGARRMSDESTGKLGTYLPALEIGARDSRERTCHGVDRGFPDRDLGNNDDKNAITGASPLLRRASLDASPVEDSNEEPFSNEFAFGVETTVIEESGGYYAKPVWIYVPRSLEPLPPKLLRNPMNLLYFHHFLNHTARVLVPYDDQHSNPFRTILPRMAVTNDSLLSLLLAYSALHRARLLNHPEPTLRIATWVEDIFPALRQALADPGKNFSDANLATAIMLTSLEIISPKAFGYDIPWQKHLGLARELITSRPGGLRGMQSNFRQDQVCSFLWSWAAYLDVIGSLSGGRRGYSTAWIFEYEYDDVEDGYDEIDCIMGFTTRCIYLLAKVADLASQCDAERIGEDHCLVEGWKPSEHVRAVADKLETAIIDSMDKPPIPCKHIHIKGDMDKWDRKSLTSTNEAFHWAALVQLRRRIKGKPSVDGEVQEAVQGIIGCLNSIPPGATAESCLLFPMFTAGCDAQAPEQRKLILERLEIAGNSGMTYVHNARTLMQQVWETNKPWETLVSTEFIG